MFSHGAGLLQTGAAKRAENQFNGVAASFSGEAQAAAVRFRFLWRLERDRLASPRRDGSLH
jgi:hypothetical protein